MAVDVLAYNALNCRTQQMASTINYYINQCVQNCPWLTNMWPQALPMGITSGSTVLVCDTSGYYRCGACCLWTVPAGVTMAQFQLWGAGAGTGGAACCGGAMPGSTGAYAIVTMPVVAGCQYTLCAGCAYCCYSADPAQSGCNIADGCPSYVTGYGLTNFCAEGGEGDYRCMSMAYSGTCRLTCTACPSGGASICNGSSYCAGGSCSIITPFYPSAKTFYGSATCGTVYGISGIFASIYTDTNIYGYHLIPPVVSPTCATVATTNTFFTSAGYCCQAFTSGTCGGYCCQACIGYFQWPGQGGTGVHVMGGSCWCGDAGRMGMVKVTYC